MKFGGSNGRRSSRNVHNTNLQQDDEEDEPLRFRSIRSTVKEQNRLVSPRAAESIEDALSELETSFRHAREHKRSNHEAEQAPRQPRRIQSLTAGKSISGSSGRRHIRDEKVETERPELRRAQSQTARSTSSTHSRSHKSSSSSSIRNLVGSIEDSTKERPQLRRVRSHAVRSSAESSSGSSTRRHVDDSSRSISSKDGDPRQPRKSKNMVPSKDTKTCSSSRSLWSSSERRGPKKSKSFSKAVSLSRIRLDEGDESDDNSIQLLERKDRSFAKKNEDGSSVTSKQSKKLSSTVQTSAGSVTKAEIMAFLAQESTRSLASEDSASVHSTRSSKSEKKRKLKKDKSKALVQSPCDDDTATAALSQSSSSMEEEKINQEERQRHSLINHSSANKLLAESVAREIFADEDDLECGVSELDDASGSYRLDKSERERNSLFYLNEKIGTMGDGLMVVDLLGDAVDYHAAEHPETVGLAQGDDFASSTMYKILRSKRHRRCLCFSIVFLVLLTILSLGLAFGIYQKSQTASYGSAVGVAPPTAAYDLAGDSSQTDLAMDSTTEQALQGQD